MTPRAPREDKKGQQGSRGEEGREEEPGTEHPGTAPDLSYRGQMRPRTAGVSPQDTPGILQHGQNQKITDKTLPDPLRQGISRAQTSSALLAKMPMRSHGHPVDQEKVRTSVLGFFSGFP